MSTISDKHRICIIEATIGDLVAFRRGFGRTKAGPFFEIRTVNALVSKGLLRAYHAHRGRRGLRISARAA
jgi:hypothetical protein